MTHSVYDLKNTIYPDSPYIPGIKNRTSVESELTHTPWQRVTSSEGSVELLPV